MKNYSVLSKPEDVYAKMLSDIESAKKEILLETYIFDNDKIGRSFRDALVRKSNEKVSVKLLIDGWGSGVKKSFFKKLNPKFGEVRFFHEFRYVFRIFGKNHERNHRKLLLVDRKISYIGSINATSSCLKWRELVLRFESGLSRKLRNSFFRSWVRYRDFSKKKMRKIVWRKFEVLHSFPSGVMSSVENIYLKLIRNAKSEILIETPYFIPSLRFRRALGKAVKRGVCVKLVLPFSSDVRVVDIFRNRYLGNLHRKGVEIFYYNGKLHSKLFLVDGIYFLLGSSNLDYRSFLYQYEINLFGKHKTLARRLRSFFNSGLKNSKGFDYEVWQKRHFVTRFMERFLGLFKEYL